MTVRYIQDYKAKHADSRPREITFHSPNYRDKNGKDKTVNVCVRMENGDVAGILEFVIEHGGIGTMNDDGAFLFVPWPCAVIEIRDV